VPLRILLRPLKEPLKERWHLAALTIVAGWGKFMLPMGVPLLTGYMIDKVLLMPAGPETRRVLLGLGGISLVLVVLLAVAAVVALVAAFDQGAGDHHQNQNQERGGRHADA